jgi:para-nitrobenzyl esterase
MVLQTLSPNISSAPPRPTPGALDVRVTGGVVRGIREGAVLAWRGIPYAAPPVGMRRFRAPQPVVPWMGVRDASRYGDVAPQPHRGQFKGAGPRVRSSENCLTVNVLSPAVPRRKRLAMPVMVFVHGGGYSAGSAQDFPGQGEGFVRSGRIVYVSFNYRLGALGYLDFSRYSTPDRPIENNLGLRDQVAALEWVRTNIRAFGGNPHNVTVFGESAGGNAIITLMATPSAGGLFARAIAQSPPSNAAYTSTLTDEWAEHFVSVLRAEATVEPDSPNELLATADVGALSRAALALQVRTPDAHPGTFCLAPVIDGTFLPEHPLDAFREGRAHRVPLIIGTNDREGAIFRGRANVLPRSPWRIQALFDHAPEDSHAAMRSTYPGLPISRAAADFGGDYAFWYPSIVVAELHSRFAPVHFYRFDIAPRIMHLLGLDATHGIEMYALFDQVDTPFARTMTALGGREPFSRAGQRMRRHWLHFACTGIVEGNWPRYTESDRLTLIIDVVDRVEADPRGERRRVWQQFLPDL